MPLMALASRRWWLLLPVVLFLVIFLHLWTTEYTSSGSSDQTLASKFLPSRLPWSSGPKQQPIDAASHGGSQNHAPQEVDLIEHLETQGLAMSAATASTFLSRSATTTAAATVTSRPSGFDLIKGLSPDGDLVRLVSSTHSASASAASATQAPVVNETAHAFTNPDMFKPHFEAVLALPSLQIADAIATCQWPDDVKPNFQHTDQSSWVRNPLPDSEIAVARADWYNFMRRELVPWEEAKGNFSGRGIVIVGGQMKTLGRIKFQLKLLKSYGSRLPVELHYWGDEINATIERDLSDIYPYFRTFDLSNVSASVLETIGPFMNGYHMKVNAVVNSHFSEVLLLDADNIPMFDPAELFRTKTYQEYGTVFWPDISRTRAENPMWPVTNTPCRMDEYEMESGQMLVDKRRFFYHLQLSSFFMRTSFYRTFILGDKDMFRFAWHALKTQFGRPGRWIATIGTRLPEPRPFFCGRSFAQHHPDEHNGTIAFLHLNAMKLMAPEVFTYFRDRGGPFEYYKTPPNPWSWDAVVPGGLKSEDTSFLNGEPSRASACIDFYDEDEIKTTTVLPRFDEFFRELGGYDVLQGTVGG